MAEHGSHKAGVIGSNPIGCILILNHDELPYGNSHKAIDI